MFKKECYSLISPKKWSNELLNTFTDEWKNKRTYIKNKGWKILNPGYAEEEVIALNINTLVSLLGTLYIPNLKGKILILEEMDACIPIEKRNLNDLKFSKIFDDLKALIFSKPEKFDSKNSNLEYEDLIKEIIEQKEYPIILNFDCGHTHPSISISQKSKIIVKDKKIEIEIVENSVLKLLKEKKK